MITPSIRTALVISALSACLAGSPAWAQIHDTQGGRIKVETVASGLNHPWGMAMLPDGSMLVTERDGRLIHIRGEDAKAVSGVPEVAARGQGGLLDVVVDEDFATSRRLWFTWSERGQGGFSTALSTATLSADDRALENVEKIFAMAKKTTTGHHFGSRIVLAPDGKLYMTMGERGDANRAQDYFDHAGSVVRLNRDGSVPADNPFADGKSGLPEIWSKGHRNPQGAAWNSAESRLWTVEHGAAARQHHVAVQVLPDLDVALHDRVVGRGVDAVLLQPLAQSVRAVLGACEDQDLFPVALPDELADDGGFGAGVTTVGALGNGLRRGVFRADLDGDGVH